MTLKDISTYTKYFISIIALVSIIQGAVIKAVTIIYHQEIEDFEHLKEYKEKSDSTIKFLEKENTTLQDWKEIRSKTKAIGLRKDVKTGEIWYRAGGDLLLYRAYYNQYRSAYFYDFNGESYECH